ncbi:Xin actin-binding repeat-containing protein 2 [Lobulomyces angularis]|nr:Xin actin-binding repeat-containing protein 2 [Lobulomyces angularis]
MPAAKKDVCIVCEKSVFQLEKAVADEKVYHKSCLRCGHCNKILSLGNYAALNGTMYCKPHFKQLFALKGNYSDGFKASAAATEIKSSKQSIDVNSSNSSSLGGLAYSAPIASSANTILAPKTNSSNLMSRISALENAANGNKENNKEHDNKSNKSTVHRKFSAEKLQLEKLSFSSKVGDEQISNGSDLKMKDEEIIRLNQELENANNQILNLKTQLESQERQIKALQG